MTFNNANANVKVYVIHSTKEDHRVLGAFRKREEAVEHQRFHLPNTTEIVETAYYAHVDGRPPYFERLPRIHYEAERIREKVEENTRRPLAARMVAYNVIWTREEILAWPERKAALIEALRATPERQIVFWDRESGGFYFQQGPIYTWNPQALKDLEAGFAFTRSQLEKLEQSREDKQAFDALDALANPAQTITVDSVSPDLKTQLHESGEPLKTPEYTAETAWRIYNG